MGYPAVFKEVFPGVELDLTAFAGSVGPDLDVHPTGTLYLGAQDRVDNAQLPTPSLCPLILNNTLLLLNLACMSILVLIIYRLGWCRGTFCSCRGLGLLRRGLV